MQKEQTATISFTEDEHQKLDLVSISGAKTLSRIIKASNERKLENAVNSYTKANFSQHNKTRYTK